MLKDVQAEGKHTTTKRGSPRRKTEHREVATTFSLLFKYLSKITVETKTVIMYCVVWDIYISTMYDKGQEWKDKKTMTKSLKVTGNSIMSLGDRL